MRITTRSIFIFILLLYAQTGLATAQTIQLEPKFPGVKPKIPSHLLSPPAPKLVRPCGKTLGTNLLANFSWRRVPGVHYYLHCISRPGVACPTQETDNPNTIVSRVQSTAHTPPARSGAQSSPLERFSGQTVNWTVAACKNPRNCTYQTRVCAITVPRIPPSSRPPQAPRHVSPADPHSISVSNPRVTFQWQSVRTSLTYRVCLFRQSSAHINTNSICGTPNSYVTAPVRTTSTVVTIPAYLARPRSTLSWTIGACNSAGCLYHGAVRSIVISAKLTAPTLVFPAEGAIASSPRPRFRWKGVSGAESYHVCITLFQNGCPSRVQALYNRPSGGDPSFVIPNSLRPGRKYLWTVGACVRSSCTYAPKRSLFLPTLLPPTLIDPKPSFTTLTGKTTFSWQRVPAADSYVLCTYTTSQQGTVATICGNRRSPRTQHTTLSHLLTSNVRTPKSFRWTVGACNTVHRPECVFQPVSRLVKARKNYQITVAIDHVNVHHDCDSVSDGEWKLVLRAQVKNKRSVTSAPHATAIFHVGSGDVIRPRQLMGVSLEKVAVNENLTITVGGLDCDGHLDGSTSLLGATVRCAGHVEELVELTGSDDLAGNATISLTPDQWKIRGNYSARSVGGSCGNNAFTAHVVVNDSQ